MANTTVEGHVNPLTSDTARTRLEWATEKIQICYQFVVVEKHEERKLSSATGTTPNV